MVEAVGTDVIQDLVADSRRRYTAERKPEPEPVRGTGWVEPAPLKPPDGINIIDAMCEAQDRADRADRLREEMERRKALAELAPPELPKARPDQRTRCPTGPF